VIVSEANTVIRHDHLQKLSLGVLLASALWTGQSEAGGLSNPDKLKAQLQAIAEKHPGRVGLCARDEGSTLVCVNENQRFSLQSVMKLVVGAAVMGAVDDGRMKLEDPVTVRREDLSLSVQPIAEIVAKQGKFETTIGDLVRRAVTQSDNAATDILVARLGGPEGVQAFLNKKGVAGLRIDRDERHLQTESSGLTWKAEYVDPQRLAAARKAVSKQAREAAYEAYRKDERDTATPKGMTDFLHALMTGRLLSPASTRYLMNVMAQTVTFPDRLRAGAAPGWTVAHKTGTSQALNGIAAATNDVGILTAPDGSRIAIAAFVADSRAPSKDRTAAIAAAARAVISSYR
jgi:beta-lactamase class A